MALGKRTMLIEEGVIYRYRAKTPGTEHDVP